MPSVGSCLNTEHWRKNMGAETTNPRKQMQLNSIKKWIFQNPLLHSETRKKQRFECKLIRKPNAGTFDTKQLWLKWKNQCFKVQDYRRSAECCQIEMQNEINRRNWSNKKCFKWLENEEIAFQKSQKSISVIIRYRRYRRYVVWRSGLSKPNLQLVSCGDVICLKVVKINKDR